MSKKTRGEENVAVAEKSGEHTRNIGERITAISSRLGSKRALARQVGLSESQLHRIVAGESQPKAEVIAAMAKAANVSAAWLLFGDETIAEPAGSYGEPDSDFVMIKPYDNQSGGSEIALSRQWLKESLDTRPENLVTACASDDAMEPTIRQGDRLLIDTRASHSGKDGIYALEINSQLFVKRLQYKLDGSIDVISDNPTYRVETIPADRKNELKLIGRIIWMGRTV